MTTQEIEEIRKKLTSLRNECLGPKEFDEQVRKEVARLDAEVGKAIEVAE